MARLKSEAGFTLAEFLIVVAILAFTMAAVVGIYQVTQRSIFFASAGEDAQLQSRAVLDRLIADFQLINSGRTTPLGAITAATATSITFAADVDNTLDSGGWFISLDNQANAGDTAVTVTPPPSGTDLSILFPCSSPLTLADGPIVETHPLVSTNCVSDSTLNLAEVLLSWYPRGSFVRSVEQVTYAWDSATGNLCRSVGTPCTPPFADAQIIASDVTSFQLTYLDGAGNTTATLDAIRAIHVSISVRSRSGDQTVTRTMNVTVRPRNM